MLPCIELEKTNGVPYSQPVSDIRHIFEMPGFVEVIRITNRASIRVLTSFDTIVTKCNLDLVEFQDAANGNRRTAVNRAYVARVNEVNDGQAIIVLKTEQSFYPVEDYATLSPIFELVNGGGGGGGGGDVTAANVGGGEELFRDKVGIILNFKTLIAGSGVTITPAADTVTIGATGGGGSGIERATLTSAGLSIIVQYAGTVPVLANLAAGDYRLTIPADTTIISLSITGNNATLTASTSLIIRILDTDGHHYRLSPQIWNLTTNQQSDWAAAGTIPAFTVTAAGERSFEWENMAFYGPAGYEIIASCT